MAGLSDKEISEGFILLGLGSQAQREVFRRLTGLDRSREVKLREPETTGDSTTQHLEGGSNAELEPNN